jgi:tetratricopeptide (TPR) repeat protein
VLSQRELGPDKTGERDLLFREAMRRFAHLCHLDDAGNLELAGSLDDPAYESVLTVLMAALVRVDAAARGSVAPANPGDLSGYLRDREYAHWAKLREVGHTQVAPQVMARVVTVATVIGGLEHPDAQNVLKVLGLADSAPAATELIDAHSMCYPPTRTSLVLRPMQPDRLGEDFVASQLTDQRGHGDITTSHIVRAIMVAGQGTLAGRRPAAWTTIAATGARWPHVRTGYLLPLLTEDPALSVCIGGNALTMVAGYAPVGLLERMAGHFPKGRHIELDPAIAVVTRRITDHRLVSTSSTDGRATLHLDLSVRLAHAGDRMTALDHARQAVDLFREAGLECLPWLGSALNNLGMRLSDLDRSEEALSATREAMTILQMIMNTGNRHFTTPYAVTLSNFSYDLFSSGQYAEAAEAAHQAVDILSRDPDAAENLAMALWNEAVALANLNRLDEAVSLQRRCVAVPELARARASFAAMLLWSGHAEQALEEADEAARIGRMLVSANPAAHGPVFLTAMDQAGKIRFELGDFEGALPLLYEALDMRRAGTAEPDEAKPGERDDSGDGLRSLVDTLLALGRGKEALRIAREAVDIRRRDSRWAPGRHQGHLAGALMNLSITLTFVGAHHEALSTSAEATGILAKRYQARPDQTWNDYASALLNQASDLKAVGRFSEVPPLYATVRDLYQRFGGQDSGNSANHLHELALDLLSSDQETALSMMDKSIAIRRERGDISEDALKSILMRGQILSQMGRHEEARESSNSAVSDFRQLARRSSSLYGKLLHRALRMHASILHEGGHLDEEAGTLTEAIQWSRDLTALPTDTQDNEVTFEFLLLAEALHDRGRTSEAAQMDQMAITAYPESPETEHSLQLGGHFGIAQWANQRGYYALLEGRYTESIELSRICIEHWRRLGDLEGEVLGLENVYLALRAQRKYPQALDVLLDLVRPLCLGGFDDKLQEYQMEIVQSMSILESRPWPVVRDWEQDEDLLQGVAEKGVDSVQTTGVLLVGEEQDILEVLGMVGPQQRSDFLSLYGDQVRQWKPDSSGRQ